MPTARLQRSSRLTQHLRLQQLFREGKGVRSDWLALRALPNGLGRTRFGCTIRRTATRSSVTRNRLKRWIRESYRIHQSEISKGLDLVAVILKNPKPSSFQVAENEFLNLCQRIELQQKRGSSSTGSPSTKRSKKQA